MPNVIEVPGFDHFHVDEKDTRRHFKCDILLFIVTFSVSVAYAAYTAGEAFSPLTYTSTCYGSQLNGEDILLKQLCYTAEGGMLTAEEQEKALHTFTCRSTFGGGEI